MIYFAFRKIGFVDEVIYCKLMAVMSRAQMEIALRFDGILGTANGLCEHFSFTVTGKQNKNRISPGLLPHHCQCPVHF